MLLGLRAVLLAILDFARIASALVVVVGVTSHLGSGAALSPRRCRIASVGASNRTEMLRLRGVLLTILRLLGLRARLLSILAVYKRRFTVTVQASWLPRLAVFFFWPSQPDMLGRASARLRQLFPQQAGSTSPVEGWEDGTATPSLAEIFGVS